MAHNIRDSSAEGAAGPHDWSRVDDAEGEYLSPRYPDLWGYGLSRERLRAMVDVPADGTFV